MIKYTQTYNMRMQGRTVFCQNVKHTLSMYSLNVLRVRTVVYVPVPFLWKSDIYIYLPNNSRTTLFYQFRKIKNFLFLNVMPMHLFNYNGHFSSLDSFEFHFFKQIISSVVFYLFMIFITYFKFNVVSFFDYSLNFFLKMPYLKLVFQ